MLFPSVQLVDLDDIFGHERAYTGAYLHLGPNPAPLSRCKVDPLRVHYPISVALQLRKLMPNL